MRKYRHPHLVRGTVHTSQGAFAVTRGIVELPDHLGAMFGWLPLDEEQRAAAATASALPADAATSRGDSLQ